MKMNLIEMEGFLRGKCLPGDMKVNETNAEYLVRKFNELESKLEESRREFRFADITMQNLEDKCEKLAAENAGLKAAAEFATAEDMWIEQHDGMLDYRYSEWYVDVLKSAMETPATNAFLAEVRAQAQSDVIEWLDAEIAAIDTMYRGDPSYEHDAYWMKSEVRDLVESAKKVFSCQQSQREAAQ